jgi:DNA-directed RNA polymerase beta' subunit/intein/homing endonuclease
MNLHVCQSAMTISESKNIISTVENFTSSQDSKPMVGFKLDAMTAGYLLTYGKVIIPKWLFWDVMKTLDSTYVEQKIKHIKKVMEWKMDLSDIELSSEVKNLISELKEAENEYNDIKEKYDKAKGKEIPPLFKKLEKAKSNVGVLRQNVDIATVSIKDKIVEEMIYTGHNLFSILLPDDIEYTIQNDKSPDGKPVFITRGVLLSGTLNKEALGSSSGSLIHHLSKDYSNQRACQFISEFCRMINVWLMQVGFSVGIYDCIATDEQLINDEVNKNLLQAKAAIESEKDPEIREMNIKVALNDVTSISRSIAKKALKPDNNILKMTDLGAGAKGSSFNLTQITGMVGQQYVGTSRIEKQFGGRTLPHFEEHPSDIRTEFASRGFIFSSYYRGMNPTETFFAAAGGRQGLIDTAVKSVTADTPIIIIENGISKYITIGEYIDGYLDNESNKQNIQHFDEANMEYLEIKENNTFIPTCDENGKVTWGEVVAITRHDPGNQLFEIKTQSGREVIVTESKSLIVWDETEQKIIPKLMKDIKINDLVPVTMNLCNPPVIIDSVDMSMYLPKTEYVYGTDFNMAVEAMTSAMEERDKIKSGWWKENNNKLFTLPYTKKASLQRATVRSNVNDIKFGYIYPYGGARENHLIPDKFKLNYENGVFIGLFLADGSVETHRKAEIRITKNNEAVQKFVTSYFEKHNINYHIEKKVVEKSENRVGGTSTMIRGNCSVLAQFLLKFVGHTSYEKYVPNEAFTAPEEFIRGLIGGYFSGDGSIGKTSIEACSVSKRLIDGIIMCCNRLGIFCKLYKQESTSNNVCENTAEIFRVDIRGQSARIFKNKIKLIENDKQKRLNEMKPAAEHRNYSSQNDIVFDPIVEINKVSVEKYPKMYDLTIPSTFNFAVANGLNLRDTADTGYIQRKMAKILEDLTASYIGTINDMNQNIIQFNYGEDNFDAAKLISVGKKNDKVIYSFIDISHTCLRYNIDYEWKIYINTNSKSIPSTKRKFTTEEKDFIKNNVIKAIYEEFYTVCLSEECVNNAFSYLEPAIHSIEIYPEILQSIYSEIRRQLKQAIVNAGESVGHVAASSMGEQNTQSSLNSFHSSGSLKANLTSGLSRLQELMNATKNPKTKSLTIFFDKTKVDVTDLATVRRLTNVHLLSRSLNDFIKNVSIEVQPTLTNLEQVWYHMFQTFVARDDISNCKYRLRLFINPSILFLSKRTLYNIGKMIETVFIKGIQFYVICSPDNIGIIDIWIEDSLNEPSSFFTSKGFEADLLLDNFVNNENKMYHLIKKIILPKLRKLHISGIEGITECYYDMNKSDEWFVQTKGGKLKCLFYNPLIDYYRSVSNDLWEINDLLGVESSKRWLKEEFSQLSKVNHRHLDILVDKMTFAGTINAVSIYGLDRKVIGPLSKAVFERPVACLLTAAQKSEFDYLRAISSCVATGKLAKFGTGLIDLISDNDAVINNPYAEQYSAASLQEQAMLTGEELPDIEEEDEDILTIEEPLELNEEDIY